MVTNGVLLYSTLHDVTRDANLAREKNMEIDFKGKRALVTGAGKGKFLFGVLILFLNYCRGILQLFNSQL